MTHQNFSPIQSTVRSKKKEFDSMWSFFLSSLGILSLSSLFDSSFYFSISLSPLLSSSSIVKDTGSSIDVSTSFTSTACSIDTVFAFIFVMSREQIPCLEGRHESNDPCDDASKSGNKFWKNHSSFPCLFLFPGSSLTTRHIGTFSASFSHNFYKIVKPFSVTDWGLLCIV